MYSHCFTQRDSTTSSNDNTTTQHVRTIGVKEKYQSTEELRKNGSSHNYDRISLRNVNLLNIND